VWWGLVVGAGGGLYPANPQLRPVKKKKKISISREVKKKIKPEGGKKCFL